MQVNQSPEPPDLMSVAKAMMPRIILRLIQHLREKRYDYHMMWFFILAIITSNLKMEVACSFGMFFSSYNFRTWMHFVVYLIQYLVLET